MGKSQRERELKHCDDCAKPESVLYRIRLQQPGPWVFVCVNCQKKVKSQPHYQYGGTWKQKKRH
jgi:hypothetical protein